MSDPRRWLDEAGGATPLERELLRDGTDVEPPAGARAAVWSGLMVQVGPIGGGGGSGGAGPSAGGAGAGAAASGAAIGGGVLKSALLGVACAVVVATGYSVIAPDVRAPPPVPAVQITPAALPAPRGRAADPGIPADGEHVPASTPDPGAPGAAVATTSPAVPSAREVPRSTGASIDPARTDAPLLEAPASEVPAAPPAAPAVGADTTSPQAVAAERASRLREESLMVGQARDALRTGNAPGAMQLLEQARVRFPGGLLAQEREALLIEALARTGQRGAAAARAAEFLRAYPQSPHAQRVQTFAQ